MSSSLGKIFSLGLAAIAFTACAGRAPARPARPIPVAPQQVSQLYDLSAGEFRRLGVAEKRLDGRRLDQPLLSAAIFHETNVRRRQAGKSVLRHDTRLDRAARLHAERMVRERFFDHINPREAVLRTPEDRALAVGFTPRYLSENIATHFDIRYEAGTPVYKVPKQKGGGFSTTPDGPPIARHTYRSFAVSLLDKWMASKGHRANILSGYPTRSGAGCAIRPASSGMDKLYCVQLFGATMQ